MRRLAIIGCGAVLEGVHEQPLLRLMRKRDLQVVALLDPVADSRARAAKSFPGAYLGTELEDALESGPDSILVLSPPRSHADILVRAVQSGLDVLCEKPLADTPSALDDVELASRQSSRRVRVAMVRRQFDTHQILRRYKGELIDESDFRITYREGAPYTWPVKSSASFLRGADEAGVLIDVGSHVVDLLLWLFGDPIVVSSYKDNASDTLAETDAELRLNLAGGEAIVRLSRRQPLPEGWLIESKLGQVWIPLGPESMIFVRSASGEGWKRLRLEGGSRAPLLHLARWRPCTSYDHAAYRQLDQFLFGDARLQATVEEGVAATRVLLAAYAQRGVPGSAGAET